MCRRFLYTDSLEVTEADEQVPLADLPEEADEPVEDFGASDDLDSTSDSTQTVYVPQTGDSRVSMAPIIVVGFALMGLSVIVLRRHCLH